MAENSKIEWTDATWNPVLGCDKISPGCKNCYAIRTAWRLQHNPNPKVTKAFEGLTVIQGGQPNWTGRVNFIPERLSEPLDWKKPKRIFVNSQSDLFHDEVTDEHIDKVYAIIGMSERHTFQILTKRPKRARDYCASRTRQWCHEHFLELPGFSAAGDYIRRGIETAWLGVSVENQQYADERIPLLLQTPAAVRWISAEPLLGALDIVRYLGHRTYRCKCGFHDTERELTFMGDDAYYCQNCKEKCEILPALDWVVPGFESGPNARPGHPDWARSLRDQCKATGVPYFFKQWGEYVPPDQFSSDGWDDVEMNASGVSVYPEGRITDSWGIMSDGSERVWRVGKKNAGRKLDGVEHNEYPVLAAGPTA